MHHFIPFIKFRLSDYQLCQVFWWRPFCNLFIIMKNTIYGCIIQITIQPYSICINSITIRKTPICTFNIRIFNIIKIIAFLPKNFTRILFLYDNTHDVEWLRRCLDIPSTLVAQNIAKYT